MRYSKAFYVLAIFIISSLISFILVTYKNQIIFSNYVPSFFNIRYSLWLFIELMLLPHSLADAFGSSCGGLLGCIDISPIFEYPVQIIATSIVILVLFHLLKSGNSIVKRILIGLLFTILISLLILPFYLQKQCLNGMLENERYYTLSRQKVPNEYFSDDYIRNNGKVMLIGGHFANEKDAYVILKDYEVLSIEEGSLFNVKPGDEFVVSCVVPAYIVKPLVREW